MYAPRILADLPNLGPRSRQMLLQAGVTSFEQLHELGAVVDHVQAKRAGSQSLPGEGHSMVRSPVCIGKMWRVTIAAARSWIDADLLTSSHGLLVVTRLVDRYRLGRGLSYISV
ncbi:TfoX/Sxy family DNA transformation protein [Comamonas humi]